MEKTWLGYSTKNIPIPSKKAYKMKLIESIEQLTRAMRWKAAFALNPQMKKSTSNN